MKRFLIFSLSVNLVLLALVISSHRPAAGPFDLPGEMAPASDVPPPSPGRSGPRAKTAKPWARLENSDSRQFVANLRAAGCPEQTIRNLVTLRIARAYRQRVLANEIELVHKQSENPNLSQSEWQKVRLETQNLREDMFTELEAVLGVEGSSLISALTGLPTGDDSLTKLLTPEKRAQTREITKQFRQDLEQLEFKAMTGQLQPEEAAKYRELQRQKQAALATVLSPAELEEYLYRNSPAADYVRRSLPEAKNESEYRQMVELALELEMSDQMNTPRRYGNESDEFKQDRDQRNTEFSRRLKELLGDDRIGEQQVREKARAATETQDREERGKQQMQKQVTTAATEVGISPENATRFFDRLQAAESTMKKRFEEFEKNLTGTPEEKSKQMEAAIKAELNRMATETMGAKGPDVVEKLFNKNR